MSETISTRCSVSVEESRSFARLSGDYNPVHLDDELARQTYFGGTIVHGVHLILRALEEVAVRHEFQQQEPATLVVAFSKAVHTNREVLLTVQIEGNEIRIRASSGGLISFAGAIEWQSCVEIQSAVEGAEFAATKPRIQTFPPDYREGYEPLRLNKELMHSLFPAVASLSGAWMADLMALTRIAGMHCPGMYAVLAGLKLHSTVRSSAAHQFMHYNVYATERRFRLARLRVTGCRLSGIVDTLFR